MKLHIRKWGNSLGLRIPKAFTEQLDIQEGSELELFAHKNTLILSKSTPSLDALLEQVHKGNMHSETDLGSIQGVEAW